jgi:peptide/nickel transport system substrate-binding protein
MGEQIALTPFAAYQGGQPKLQKFVVQVFATDQQLVNAFEHNQLTAAEGLNNVPTELRKNRSVVQNNLLLRAADMVFFKTSAGVLAEQPVRQALIQASDIPDIIKHLGYPTREIREPLLIGQLGYDPSLAQPSFDLTAAKATLDSNGWVVGKDGIRAKANQPLTFTLTAADTSEDRLVSRLLQQQWSQLGVKLNVQLLDAIDFQNALTYHSYDAILNGISIGTDPDVFVYWDSSQADIRSANRLNLSEWKNPTADASLEAGRTRLDPILRIIKYKPFLEAWQHDSPALGLYQPRSLYLTHGLVSGLGDQAINTPADRFDNVQNWEIRQAKVTN